MEGPGVTPHKTSGNARKLDPTENHRSPRSDSSTADDIDFDLQPEASQPQSSTGEESCDEEQDSSHSLVVNTAGFDHGQEDNSETLEQMESDGESGPHTVSDNEVVHSPSLVKLKDCFRSEENLAAKADEDDSQSHKELDPKQGNLGTPSSVRRSNRATKTTNEAASAGRTTRSQINPDIIAKQKSFMHKYQIAVKSSMDSYVRSAAAEPDVKTEQHALKRKWDDLDGNDPHHQSPVSSPIQEKKFKRSATSTPSTKAGHFMESHQKFDRHDTFCWSCHQDGEVVECRQCPRVFHQRCVQLQSPIPSKWMCTECTSVRNAEKHCRVGADQLSGLLGFAMDRIKSVVDAYPFFKPVNTDEFPHYPEYVVFPVDISQMEDKLIRKTYLSTRAFLAEFRWILHNCIIFNSPHSKLTSTARTLMKVCKHEMAEIDTCADCYFNAHTKRDTWFLEPCRRPHLLLWAKLKGFPHWPAKAMKANKEGNVDVRFFGAHDRAWVPVKDCYLYSREMPMQVKNQRKANLIASIEEVDQHIKKLTERFGSFAYPPVRTAYNPQKEDDQLQLVLPGFEITDDPPVGHNQTSDIVDESSHSDSDPGEPAEEPSRTDTPTPPAAVSSQPATVASVQPVATPVHRVPTPVHQAPPHPDEVDRTEDCNFLAMLQLAPRVDASLTSASTSAAPSPTATSTVVDGADKSTPSRALIKPGKVKPSKLSVDAAGDHSNRIGNELPSDSVQTKKIYMATPFRRTTASKDVIPVKVEVQEDEDVEPDTKDSSLTLSIGHIVGNYKPNPTLNKPRADVVPKVAPKSAVKPNAKPPANKTPVTVSKATPKGSSKSGPVKPPPSKAVSKPVGPRGAAATVIRQQVADDEEELDPAMYLDPTITITLINNDSDKKAKPAVPEISSSDLQALNALGENVSITVVPKKKVSMPLATRSKENDASSIEHPMVIEVDPTALQKSRPSQQHQQQSAKARKSFPKPRPSGQSQQPPKSAQKGTTPPMVTIPSRHVGAEQPSRPSQPATTSRIPSITVRPVSQTAPHQSSIIVGATDSAAGPKQSATGNGGALTLNTMHALGPESTLGTGGLLLTFNRPTPSSATGASSTSGKMDCGSLSAQLAARTQQISDMVRNTLDTLMQEISSAGSLEATVLQLQLELERSRAQHAQETDELKRLLEAQQASAEADKQRALADLKRQLDAERERQVAEVKQKQWCASCSQEAIFYCCWNTAYCDYPCQQSHWPKHMATCANGNQNTEYEAGEGDTSDPTSEASIKISPQKSIPVAAVNGSPGQVRKASKTSSSTSRTDMGYAVITSSDVSVSLSTSNSALAARVGQAVSGAESLTPTVAPIKLVVSTAKRSSEKGQTTSLAPTVQGVKCAAHETNDEAS